MGIGARGGRGQHRSSPEAVRLGLAALLVLAQNIKSSNATSHALKWNVKYATRSAQGPLQNRVLLDMRVTYTARIQSA